MIRIAFSTEGPAVFPIRDDVPSARIPFVNYALIGACVAMYLLQMSAPGGFENFVSVYGMIPYRVTHNDTGPLLAALPTPVQTRDGRIQIVREERELPAVPIPAWMTMFTCMFLHGSLMHIVGNMWFLVIFGDNIEDRYGHVPYLLMYLLSGLAASILQLVSGPSSPIPTVGASGAIAGVMGSYFLLFPHARIHTIIPLGLIFTSAELPAPLFLGIWFLLQIGSAVFTPGGMGGVAWWAHIGGFAAGLGLTLWGKHAGWLTPLRPHRASVDDWMDRFRQGGGRL